LQNRLRCFKAIVWFLLPRLCGSTIFVMTEFAGISESATTCLTKQITDASRVLRTRHFENGEEVEEVTTKDVSIEELDYPLESSDDTAKPYQSNSGAANNSNEGHEEYRIKRISFSDH
jgi:hypothetical protein